MFELLEAVKFGGSLHKTSMTRTVRHWAKALAYSLVSEILPDS